MNLYIDLFITIKFLFKLYNSEEANAIFTKILSEFRNTQKRTSLAVQWLRFYLQFRGHSSILGWETKVPHAAWSGQKKKKVQSRKLLRENYMLINKTLFLCLPKKGKNRDI